MLEIVVVRQTDCGTVREDLPVIEDQHGGLAAVRTYEYIADEGFPYRAGRAVLRLRWRRPVYLLVFSYPIIFGLVFGLINESWRTVAVGAAVTVVWIPALAWLIPWRMAKQVRVHVRAGTCIRTEFSDANLTMSVGDVSSRVPLARLQHLARSGDMVVFDCGNRRMVQFLPSQVFPDAEAVCLQGRS